MRMPRFRHAEAEAEAEAPRGGSRAVARAPPVPPAEGPGSIGADVMPDGHMVPDRPGDPRSRLLAERYAELCATETTVPLTAMAAFTRIDATRNGGETGLRETRCSFAVSVEVFEGGSLEWSNGILGRLNEEAIRLIESRCERSTEVGVRDLCEYLGKAAPEYTHVMSNNFTFMRCAGKFTNPTEWTRHGWSVHPCFDSPMRKFDLRSPHIRKNVYPEELIMSIDETVPESTLYLVHSDDMRLHLGRRRVYYGYESAWLTMVERCNFDVTSNARAERIRVKFGDGSRRQSDSL